MIKTLLAIFLGITLVSCHAQATLSASEYDDSAMWYVADNNADYDVFYVVSTNVASAIGTDNVDTYRAFLTEDDRALMAKEFAYIAKKFGKKANTYAPYYHQYTMSSIGLPDKQFMPLRQEVAKEVFEAFDYYLEHYNKGRNFVLMGFSQGAMHVQDLLRHMDDATYKRCIAAYSLGYRLSAEDLKHPHIKVATGAEDTGVTISFNSANSVSAVWPMLTDGAVTCINPINWRTDSTPATTDIDGVTATVHIDKSKQVLIVEGLQPERYYIPSLSRFCPVGNYHLGDLIFYPEHLVKNATLRASKMK